MIDHVRKYIVIYGLVAWTVFGMFTMGGLLDSGPEFARPTR